MSKFVGVTLSEKTYVELEYLKKEKGQWISTADLLRDIVKEGLKKMKEC